MTKINLNEGKKYDATQVSTEGITQEELKRQIKRHKNLLIFIKATAKI